jgi:hypothetical protein
VDGLSLLHLHVAQDCKKRSCNILVVPLSCVQWREILEGVLLTSGDWGETISFGPLVGVFVSTDHNVTFGSNWITAFVLLGD